jgi:hypothetical protein
LEERGYEVVYALDVAGFGVLDCPDVEDSFEGLYVRLSFCAKKWLEIGLGKKVLQGGSPFGDPPRR